MIDRSCLTRIISQEDSQTFAALEKWVRFNSCEDKKASRAVLGPAQRLSLPEGVPSLECFKARFSIEGILPIKPIISTFPCFSKQLPLNWTVGSED
jgi:hypothetical protein